MIPRGAWASGRSATGTCGLVASAEQSTDQTSFVFAVWLTATVIGDDRNFHFCSYAVKGLLNLPLTAHTPPMRIWPPPPLASMVKLIAPLSTPEGTRTVR